MYSKLQSTYRNHSTAVIYPQDSSTWNSLSDSSIDFGVWGHLKMYVALAKKLFGRSWRKCKFLKRSLHWLSKSIKNVFKYSAEVEREQIKLNKVPNKFIIDKTTLGILQTASRSEMNTKTIYNYNTAILLQNQARNVLMKHLSI